MKNTKSNNTESGLGRTSRKRLSILIVERRSVLFRRGLRTPPR